MCYFLFFGEIKVNTMVKITAPRIDQINGYFIPRIIGDQISGRSNSLPSQVPMIAPIKPTIAERMHPPRLNPTNWRAIEPVMAAIINRIIKSSNDTLSPKIVHPKIIFLCSNLNYKEQIHLLIIKKGILIFLCYIRKSILFIIIFKC